MSPPPLEIRRVPRGPLGEAWDARVEDWVEDGRRIIRLSREYRRHYRATICAKCTPEEQARRRCTALRERCSTRSCGHMNRAFYSRYRRMARARVESHPLAERIRLNAALGGGERGARAAGRAAAPISPALRPAGAGILAKGAGLPSPRAAPCCASPQEE